MRNSINGVLILMSWSLVVSPCLVLAEEGEVQEVPAEEWAEEGRNDLGLFLGATLTEGDGGFSVGLGYEYRLNRSFGIGGLLEYTAADFREWVLGVPFYWHPRRQLRLLVVPGYDFDRPDGSSYFLLRLGAVYSFDVGKGFEIAPELNVDFTSEETAFVLGAAIARGF